MLVLVIKQLFFRNRVRMTISSCITVLLTLYSDITDYIIKSKISTSCTCVYYELKW